jgi:hypothetical protein
MWYLDSILSIKLFEGNIFLIIHSSLEMSSILSWMCTKNMVNLLDMTSNPLGTFDIHTHRPECKQILTLFFFFLFATITAIYFYTGSCARFQYWNVH